MYAVSRKSKKKSIRRKDHNALLDSFFFFSYNIFEEFPKTVDSPVCAQVSAFCCGKLFLLFPGDTAEQIA